MKLIVYILFGMLCGLFGIGIMEQPIAFMALLACVLLIDYLPEQGDIMIALLVAFFLYNAEAGWPWWVAYSFILVFEAIGIIYKVNRL